MGVMAWLFVVAQAGALVRLVVARSPYRWFLLALALWVVQTISVLCGPQFGAPQDAVNAWLWGRWMPVEALVILATTAAFVASARAVPQSFAVTPLPLWQM